ncbi:hypothetical protein UJ101_02318 [Flavobacteriaceae bacterium UJ101]|nr:hypothetical protein UJ101_02318 [Flavobacteriaceae bacterium UJ101]
MPITTVTLNDQDYLTTVRHEEFLYHADEPKELGGENLFATPSQYLLGSLGSCTAITLRMYAKRKEWDLGEITIALRFVDQLVEGKTIRTIEKKLNFSNGENLEEKQIKRLYTIAEKCPVAKIIKGETKIITV